MPNLLRLSDNTWPCTRADLERDNPATWFPPNLSQAQPLTDFGYALPDPTDPPSHNPTTHRAVEVRPIQDANGTWQQAWELLALPPPVPAPDWLGFAGWLYQFPAIAAAMEVARASTDPQGEPATTGLPAAMDEARLRQNYPAFALSWGQFLLASHMAPADLAEIVGKAVACHLPAEFVAALQPEAPAP